MKSDTAYLMENEEESIRLEVKTNPEEVKEQAIWCGIKPGLRVLDAGCGPGKTTSVLYEMIQPGGSIVGVDFSEKRINYARKHYGGRSGLDFYVHDVRNSLGDFGQFDIIWVRFVLEYYRAGSHDIVRNLKSCLKPGGYLCMLDLDHNCLNHYELPPGMREFLPVLMARLDEEYNFDTYAGRKLYSYLYDNGFEDIKVHLMPHHLIYGEIRDGDAFNWMKKVEVAAMKLGDLFNDYPGGYETFHADFKRFFYDTRRFTYTPLILCKGMRPVSG